MITNGATSTHWKQWRRLQAVELKEQGWTQQEIAEALGVSKVAVSQWMKSLQEQGVEALRARPHTGAPRRLSPPQLSMIPELLSQSPEIYGFRGEVWTCARVTKVIKEEFGIVYHKGHVARLLTELKWTPQIPRERATQQNEEKVQRWRTEIWPDLKKRRIKTAK